MELLEENTPALKNPEHIQKSRTNLLWLLGLAVSFALGLGAGYFIWVRPLESQLKVVQAAAAQAVATQEAVAAEQAAQDTAAQTETANDGTQTQEVKRYDVPIDDDPVLGSADSPITIIEFSDYQCPYCRQWHVEVFPKLLEKYGDKIRFVYRDFPLYSIHPAAEAAAQAANCAGEQKRYWEFSEFLYANQGSLNQPTYEKIAQDLKLNLDNFKQCIAEDRYKKEIEADATFAGELGVRSTPTFFINGLAVVGAQPFEVFEQVIDMELAGEIP